MKEAGAGESADGQTDHPHQTLLVATGVDKGHDEGAAEGAATDDGDEQHAIADTHYEIGFLARIFRRRSRSRETIGGEGFLYCTGKYRVIVVGGGVLCVVVGGGRGGCWW